MTHKNFLLLNLAILSLVVLFVGACSPVQSDSLDIPPASMPSVVAKPNDLNIKAGDRLELFVKEDPVFNGVYEVREGGDIIIPAVGRIQLKGLSVRDAEQQVKGQLEKGQLKDATVILDRISNPVPLGGAPVAGADRILVYLTGEVQKPGQHMLTVPEGRPLGVYEAILISGGLGRFADEQKAHILRMDKKRVRHRIPVNIRLISQGSAPDPAIGQGDVVVVPEKVFGF